VLGDYEDEMATTLQSDFAFAVDMYKDESTTTTITKRPPSEQP